MAFVNVSDNLSDLAYYEKVSSKKTELLFLGLALLFLLLALWRLEAAGRGTVSTLLFAAFFFFLFYALNYRTLTIRLTPQELKLRFGLFRWTIPIDNVERSYQDEASLWRIGGAGIHFSSFEGRYRVMFNFLEYPRVVVSLKEKRGPVRDVAFSTQQPEQVMALLREFAAKQSE
ncbi:MAG: hypothetical protein RRC07_02270 [Anaerolineae bacterium]|nr:hypothetical protein [Anaerolineae bacterium]